METDGRPSSKNKHSYTIGLKAIMFREIVLSHRLLLLQNRLGDLQGSN